MDFVRVLLCCLVIFIATLTNINSKSVEIEDNDSIEIPPRRVTKQHNSNNGLSFLRPADDALFNFINKIVNTSYLSSKMVMNRVKTQSEIRKQIEDQVEEFLESLPSVPIPLLDDLTPTRSNDNIKETK